jgi:hypothetical protein
MHSIRSLLLVTGAILGFAVLAPPATQAAAPVFGPFTVDKECGPSTGFTGLIPSICKITASSVAALVGAKVTYYGPTINAQFVSSTVVLDAADGTASGYCMVDRFAGAGGRNVRVPRKGAPGSLAGFQAVVNVTFVPGGVGVNKFHWRALNRRKGRLMRSFLRWWFGQLAGMFARLLRRANIPVPYSQKSIVTR